MIPATGSFVPPIARWEPKVDTLVHKLNLSKVDILIVRTGDSEAKVTCKCH